MAELLNSLARAIGRLLGYVRTSWSSPPSRPIAVGPPTGWPGSILSIGGSGFSASRDENDVRIGSEPALVIAAVPDSLTVLAGRNTRSGLVEVRWPGGRANAPFSVRPWPDPGNILDDG